MRLEGRRYNSKTHCTENTVHHSYLPARRHSANVIGESTFSGQTAHMSVSGAPQVSIIMQCARQIRLHDRTAAASAADCYRDKYAGRLRSVGGRWPCLSSCSSASPAERSWPILRCMRSSDRVAASRSRIATTCGVNDIVAATTATKSDSALRRAARVNCHVPRRRETSYDRSSHDRVRPRDIIQNKSSMVGVHCPRNAIAT
jgi:hypothetical protein